MHTNSMLSASRTLVACSALVACGGGPGPQDVTSETHGPAPTASGSASMSEGTGGSGSGDSEGTSAGPGGSTSSAATTAASTGATTDTGGEPTGTPTEPNLRVAFIGDQSSGSATAAVLDLVVAEGAKFLIIAGDFDYNDDPDAWDNLNVSRLGADYPVFAVAGNHDEAAFYGAGGYQTKITARIQNALADGADCSGELGLNSACHYKGLFMVFSGVDVYNGQAESEQYIRDQLAADDAIWSVCAWHKNQNDMQAGGKGDETGWGVYRACQDGGALIVTGHEHSYSRTRTLTDVGNVAAGHGATGEHGLMLVGEGSTFVTVSGIGGQDLRDYHADEHDDDTWWSTIYTVDYYRYHGDALPNPEPRQGALFIDFHVDGDPYKAYGYFKNIDGEIVDEYEIVRDPEMSGGETDSGDPTTGGEEPDLVISSFDDAYVDGEQPDVNFGDVEDLLVDQSPVYETYLRPLGLDAIPMGTTIASATLRLTAHDEGDTVEVRRVSADWSEGAITYNNRPAAGGVELSFTPTVGAHELDITAIVQSWFEGAPNYGLLLRSDGGNGSDYYSSENGFDGPTLELVYAP